MSPKLNLLLLTIVTGVGLFLCIRRDVQLEKLYTGDLRNRVVGARLQKDGKLPYFYKWNPADSTRYYDPQNFDSFKVANITATPFTHQLMAPIADWPQRSISKAWLVGEYVLFAAIVLMALTLTKTPAQRWSVILLALIFACTSAWKGHVAAGQYYLIIPALCMAFYCLVSRQQSLLNVFLAGLVAVLLVLIRPNTILFFLPFLFLGPRLFSRYSLAFITPVVVVLLFALGSNNSLASWNNFRAAMKEQVKVHQDLQPATQSNAADPGYRAWEGWDKAQIEKDAALHPFNAQSEHGNLFVIVNRLLGIRLPVWLLTAIALLSVVLLSLLFYKKNIITLQYSLLQIALLGFCIYMISDICSPFHRFEYNTVQWLFPLLLIAAHVNKRFKYIYTAILAGLLLCILQSNALPFEHTAGEYIVFAAVLALAFVYKPPADNGLETH